MTRILVNHFTPMPNRITGISVYTWALLEALVRHGRKEYVLSTNWDLDKLPEEIRGLGIPLVRRKTPANESLAALRATLDVPRIAREHGCSAVFHPQPNAMLAGMRRSVVTIHDLYRVEHGHLYKARQRLQWQQFTARGFRQAGRLIAVSEATARAIEAAYPDVAARVRVVHEASPLAAGTALPPRPPIEGDYVLMVANVTPNKNVGLLVDALKLLADRNLHPQIALVGRDEFGVLPGLMGGRTDLALRQFGSVSNEALRGFYAHATAYVNTSLTEGFCLPLLEAHTFGVPVICSDLPVLREVAGEGALFVSPKDAAGLADALERIHTNAALLADLRGKATRNSARFSWEKAARETEAVIGEVEAG